jgi:hypothetical protein
MRHDGRMTEPKPDPPRSSTTQDFDPWEALPSDQERMRWLRSVYQKLTTRLLRLEREVRAGQAHAEVEAEAPPVDHAAVAVAPLPAETPFRDRPIGLALAMALRIFVVFLALYGLLSLFVSHQGR